MKHIDMVVDMAVAVVGVVVCELKMNQTCILGISEAVLGLPCCQVDDIPLVLLVGST